MFDLRAKVNGRPLLVGHRGAMAIAPENTLVSFEAGVQSGADIVEMDVQLTADGQVVVFHDTTLERKTGHTGMIGNYTAEFLQTLDVGGWFDAAFAGATIPLFTEVLDWAKTSGTPLMIELKHGPVFEPRLDTAVVHLIEDYNLVDQVVVISFDQFALQRVQQANAHIATSFIYITRLLDPLVQVSGLNVHALSPATDFLTRDEVKLIQNAGYACSPGGFWWDYDTLLDWGVDTISASDPGLIRHKVEGRR